MNSKKSNDFDIYQIYQDIAEIKTNITWIKKTLSDHVTQLEDTNKRVSACELFIENAKVKMGFLVGGVSAAVSIIIYYLQKIFGGGS